ncbi:MAG: ammonia-forming cytochrome c nitrite reductase subunit c552 [Alphaproteobacteria bacterium]|uniref:nitrite reductase (cytochrome; ammonia-forming) n=1 Tax=Candidatus Nitrobium versatile TaxID=2884831 RepID=A0A953JBW6_9BACT|nr:ammonia-forming cytochrome c nitrite reductase subunit c552 [Candidatus Nitrobium versatile]
MGKGKLALFCLSVLLVLTDGYVWITAAHAQKPQSTDRPQKAVKASDCYGCHDAIKDFHTRGKHAKVSCSRCHEALDLHLKDSAVKPATRTDHAACGQCHKEQYESFVSANLESKAKVEKATFKSRSPLFDTLSMPHAFTKEHDEPRSHIFGLMDHFIVDRAYGGRFQLKDWSKISDAKSAETNLWKILIDREPTTTDQKTFIPQSAVAANPVCLQCKSQDHILEWKYLGDKDPRARWDRTSKVVELARNLRHPVNCYMCHDPHSSQPRVVRDALIQAIVDRGEGTYPYDKEKSKETTVTKVMFRDNFRAIGLLNRPDSNVMCAQCHVEYNCNPGHIEGFDPTTDEKITVTDRRTNLIQWVNIFDYPKRMEEVRFKDFKHAVTGASLNKLQHPETETFWGSRHERAGVECKDCHMPKITKSGKTYTWHGQQSARYMLKNTCERCHPAWSDQEAEYQVDAIQNYVRGKITKAEFWLGQFIEAYARAKAAGVSPDILREARKNHDVAHIYWEWWTAENSDGFHNPEAARESLTRSIDLSQKGIKTLNEAIEAAGKKQ